MTEEQLRLAPRLTTAELLVVTIEHEHGYILPTEHLTSYELEQPYAGFPPGCLVRFAEPDYGNFDTRWFTVSPEPYAIMRKAQIDYMDDNIPDHAQVSLDCETAFKRLIRQEKIKTI